MQITKISDRELEITEETKRIITKEELEQKKKNAEAVVAWTTEYLESLK